MATTLDPARLSPGTGDYPLDAGHIDEAFAPTGAPRRPYVGIINALARHDLAVLRERPVGPDLRISASSVAHVQSTLRSLRP
jgi:hypothetical protein